MAAAAIVSGAYAASASASTYTVQKGDSLSVIAKKYQTSVADLKKLNNLTSDLIRISQVLQIPDTSTAQPVVQYQAPTPATNYTVVSGDTLSQIARKNGISLADLKQWNNMTSDLIFPGQQLKVANGANSQAAVAAVQPAPVTTSTSDYVIQSGDTLSKIASKFGTTVTALKQLNGLSSDLIYAGKTLKVSGTVVPAAAPAAPPPVAAAAPVVQPSSTNTYVIQSGDTLSGIAGKFGATVASLMQLNGMSSSFIYAGQTLTVSGQASVTSQPATNVSTSADTSNSSVAAMVTLVAKGLIGTPYAWGGNTTAGFDCSGFIYYVYNQAGLSLARYSAQGYADRSYEVDNPQPGDLVFFKNTYKAGISHVGIYLGNNQFIQAADEQHGVIISSLTNSYYQQHFDSFARFY
jgi:LysM repeat protein